MRCKRKGALESVDRPHLIRILISKNKPQGGTLAITMDDFKKIDLRVAKITEAERIEGTDKLLKLKVTLGIEERQLVAGIAQDYPPEELIGKQLIVVANLEPAVIRGVQSQGMLLAAMSQGRVILATMDAETEPGSKIL
ncbi:methionine--tRNA ligase subunit beta [bacterium]|nr:methionine--tRNA ligase subunit beta [bacterium]